MRSFYVTVEETCRYNVWVEAESHDEAGEIALDEYYNSEPDDIFGPRVVMIEEVGEHVE